MKKHFYLFVPFLLACFGAQTASAQCTTEAGTLQSWPAAVCAEEDFSVVPNADAILDADDVRLFVAFTGADPVGGTVLAVSADGFFPFNPLFLVQSPFQVAPVAGNDDGSGGVDWDDPCLSVGPSAIVTYFAAPMLDVAGTTLTCQNPFAQLSASSPSPGVTFSWTGPAGYTAFGPNPTTPIPGVYCVTVTDQNGCTAEACVTVVVDADPPAVSVVQPSLLSCANPQATLEAFVIPEPGLTVFWTGPGGFTSDQLSVTVDVPGIYIVAVTDQTGCSNVATIQLETENPLSFDGMLIGCYGDVVTTTVSAPTLTAPLTYLWSTGDTTASLSFTLDGTQTGPVCVTVTDAVGCTSAWCLPDVIVSSSPMEVDFILLDITCNQQHWTIQVSGGSPPYAYLWNNGSTSTLIADQSGIYGITVTDASGCSAVLDTFLEVTGQCAFIRGQVFRDDDANCALSGGDSGLAGWFVQAGNGAQTFYGTTDAAGFYEIPVFPGAYDVSVQTPNPQVWSPCFPSVGVGSLAVGDTATVDFPIQPLVDCPLLTIDISTPILRRCFSNNYYYGTYCNEGTATAEDAYFDLTLDPFLIVQTASLPYTDLGNNVLRFEVGDLESGECGNFNVQVQVSCDAALGQTHCTEAHIYPDTLCGQNVNWSGASVEIGVQCDPDSVRFTIRNAGPAPMSVSLEYVVIEDAVMLMLAGSPPLGPTDSITIARPANGATWRVVANQEPFHPSLPALPTGWIEGCASGGSVFSTGFVNLFSDGDGDSWLDVDCTPNVGAYDPNDKQGFPLGYGPAHYVRPGTPLEYLIRFQNTGTDTAFNVVIRDTLSAWLDVASVQPGASSHPYRFELYGENILLFSFDNILLPDSNINEAASHGFVRFGVLPRADVPLETDIFNSAAIYFDFNEPVLTNTTVHRIGENFLVGAWQPARPGLALRVSPHPMADEAWVEISGLPTGQALTVRVFDAQGRLLRSENAVSPTFRLRRDGLDAGFYLLEIRDEKGLTGSAKLIVR